MAGFISSLFGNGSAAASSGGGSPGLNQLKAFCAASQWGIDAFHGDNGIELRFKTDVGVRTILISANDTAIAFTAISEAAFYPSAIPDHFGMYLLLRNYETKSFGGWQTCKNGDKMGFNLFYSAYMVGMNAVTFRAIVTAMLTEVAGMDQGLKGKGLL